MFCLQGQVSTNKVSEIAHPDTCISMKVYTIQGVHNYLGVHNSINFDTVSTAKSTL